MLRCANCQSAAIMPKSGLCLACGFIAGVEKYQKDEQSLATDISELDNTEDSNTDTRASEQDNISDVLDEESLTLSETEATSLIEDHEQEHLTAVPELDNIEDSNTDIRASEQENISDVLDEESPTLSEIEATSLIEEHEQEHLTAVPELDNTADSNTDTRASEQENISDVLDEESLTLSETEATSLIEDHEQEHLTAVPELDNTEDSNTDTRASEQENISDVLDEESLTLSETEAASLIEEHEQERLTAVPELDNTADSNTDTRASEQENISDVLDEESLALSETEETSLIEAHEQEHLTAIPELDNTEDSNTDIRASEQEGISNTLSNEKTALSVSAVNHQTKVDDFDWDKSIPPFLQVTHKAKLKKSHTRIIESCQKDLEPLKGALVSKGEGEIRSFMVSSTYRKEGVTTAALAVSIALSRFGHSKVLLIDANAVAPSLHDAFSLTGYLGFIDYISEVNTSINDKQTVHSIYQEIEETTRSNNSCSWAKYAYYTEYQGLYVMPYALKIDSSSLWDVVESKNFNKKLEQLKQAFDYIVFDTPAILGSSEPALLSQYIEGVILVIEAEKTKWEVTELAVNNVRNSGGTFVGAILNKRKFYIPKFLYRWI